MMYNPADTTQIGTNLVVVAQLAAKSSVGIEDFVPATDMLVFRSHYPQVVQDNGVGYQPHNGFITNVFESGGDVGGAVITVQSELDYINDTNPGPCGTGCEQIGLFQ